MQPRAIVLILAMIYIGGMGLAYGFNLALTPVYHDNSPDYPIWRIMNDMAVPVVLVLLPLNAWRKFRVPGGGDSAVTREYLGTTIAFYAAIALIILFFWEWFWSLWPENEAGEFVVISHLIHYPAVDVIFTLLSIEAAIWLYREARAALSAG